MPDLAEQPFEVDAINGRQALTDSQERTGLLPCWRVLALQQHPRSEPVPVAAGLPVRGSVHTPKRIRVGPVDAGIPQLPGGRSDKIRRHFKAQSFAGSGMLKLKRRGVQMESGRGATPVERITQDGQAFGGRMHANLVGPPRHGLCPDPGTPLLPAHHPETGFSPFAAPGQGPGHIAVSNAQDPGDHRKLLAKRWPVRHQKVLLVNLALRELTGQGTIGLGCLAKDQQPTGVFIETMDDGERRPPGFPVFQPVVDSLTRMGCGSMGVPARRLVDHQQIVVFMHDAGWPSPGWHSVGRRRHGLLIAGPPAGPGCITRR